MGAQRLTGPDWLLPTLHPRPCDRRPQVPLGACFSDPAFSPFTSSLPRGPRAGQPLPLVAVAFPFGPVERARCGASASPPAGHCSVSSLA